MDKHIQMAGILNIVYRSITFLGGVFLLFLTAFFWRLFDYLVGTGEIRPHEVPMELVKLVPIVLTFVGIWVILVSIAGIVAAAAVLKRKEWGRILLLVISFFSLIRIPLGTALGVYSIWVLLKDETIRTFTPGVKREATG